jgi:agmatinase
LSSADALAILWRLGEIDFRGMDVVEVCPPFDHADVTALAVASIVQRYLQLLAGRLSFSFR